MALAHDEAEITLEGTNEEFWSYVEEYDPNNPKVKIEATNAFKFTMPSSCDATGRLRIKFKFGTAWSGSNCTGGPAAKSYNNVCCAGRENRTYYISDTALYALATKMSATASSNDCVYIQDVVGGSTYNHYEDVNCSSSPCTGTFSPVGRTFTYDPGTPAQVPCPAPE